MCLINKVDAVFLHQPCQRRFARKFQVSLQIDLTHLQEFDPELAEAVVANARRFNLLASDAVWELIPDYRERDNVAPRDALDVYIQHRTVMEDRVTGQQTQGQQSQSQQPGQQQQGTNQIEMTLA